MVVNAEKLELQVLAHLLEERDSGRLYDLATKRLERENGTETKMLMAEIGNLEGRLKDIRTGIKKLVTSIEHLGDEDIPEVTEKLKQRKAEEAALINKLQDRKLALEAIPNADMLDKRVQRAKAEMDRRIADFEKGMKQRWVQKDSLGKAKALMEWQKARKLALALLDGDGYGVFVTRMKNRNTRVAIRSDMPEIVFEM